MTCVVIQNDVIHCSKERGILPLLNWLEQTPCVLLDAVVADKVVGKASALLLAYGGVRSVYANTIGMPAIEVFQKQHIPFCFDEQTETIRNRDDTGDCLMEQTVRDIDAPQEAYATLMKLVKGK